MISRQGSGLTVALHGDLTLTDDELHLLRGIAASQASAARHVEIEMFELASNWAARQYLTLAVTLMGAALAVAGYWLPMSHSTQLLPGAALKVARLHGTAAGMSAIAWP